MNSAVKLSIETWNWQEFTTSGAFLRVSSQEVWVWSGPQSLSKTESDKIATLYFSPFFESSVQAITFQNKPLIVPVFEFIKRLEPFLGKETLTADFFKNPSKADYEHSFQFINGQIQRGEIEKAVLVNFFKGELVKKENYLAGWIISLLKTPENLWPFGYWDSSHGVVGATPEILFKKTTECLETVALAGTLAKSENKPVEELLKNPKEVHEHQIVVKDLMKQLSYFGKPQKSEMQVLELPLLYHLITHLKVLSHQLPDVYEIIRRLHPTPALGVSPRNYGYHWLRELPDQALRYFHGAPLVFNLGDWQLGLVALRHLEWNAQNFLMGSGSGIVAGSELEKEWQEILVKKQMILHQLGIKK